MSIGSIRKIRAIFLCAFALMASDCATVPITGRSQLLLISNQDLVPGADQVFQRFMDSIHDRVLLSSSLEDASTVDYVRHVGNKVIEASELGQGWEIIGVKTREANAFALPNKKIVVFTGLLPVAQTEAGLAAIIGHEIGHVIARHSAERLSQALLADVALQALNLALTLANSKYQPEVAAATGLGLHYGILLPFSRNHELEADQIGLFLMAKAGYHPGEAIEVWNRMAARGQSGPWEFLSTHPAIDTRVAQLQDWLPDALMYYADPARPLPANLGEAERIREKQFQREALAPIAPRPSFLPGYWWRMQSSNQETPTTYRYDKMTPCGSNSCIVVAADYGGTSLLTEDYQLVEARTGAAEATFSPPLKIIEWPLRVGAQWSHSVRISGSSGSTRDDTLRVEVVDYEPVTVPAGSFMAFRMIASLGGTKFQEYWYSPEVRHEVKVITRSGLFSNVTAELLDYQRTNAPVINLSGNY